MNEHEIFISASQALQRATEAYIKQVEVNRELVEALAGILADYEATIEIAKQGKVAEISIGQFGRIRLAKERLAKAGGK